MIVDLEAFLKQIKGGLIVSCQSFAGEPLYGSQYMVEMAKAAAAGGAVGIRCNGIDVIKAIRRAVNLPIIGIIKDDKPGYSVRITPTVEHARQVAAAGADIIALDATDRPHPDGLSLVERIQIIHKITGCPLMADISNLQEGLVAEEMGADLVATTLSGYTDDSQKQIMPDFELLKKLVENLKVPVIAEGRIATPEQAAVAIELGAWAVVVGSAITRPQWLTERFVMGLKQR